MDDYDEDYYGEDYDEDESSDESLTDSSSDESLSDDDDKRKNNEKTTESKVGLGRIGGTRERSVDPVDRAIEEFKKSYEKFSENDDPIDTMMKLKEVEGIQFYNPRLLAISTVFVEQYGKGGLSSKNAKANIESMVLKTKELAADIVRYVRLIINYI